MKQIIAICLVLTILFTLWGCENGVPEERAERESATEQRVMPTTVPTEPEPFMFEDVHYTLSLPIYELVSFTVLEEPYQTYTDFVFNEKGQLISKKETDYGDLYEYEYDDQGRLIKETETESGDIKTVYHYTYYDDIPYEYYDTRYGHGNNFTYGLVKKMTRSSTIDFYDGATWEYTYEFDDQGRVIREISVFGPDYSRDEEWFEYNEQGLITHQVGHSYDTPRDRTSDYDSEYTFTYDSAGRLIQEDHMQFPSWDDYPSYYTDTFEYDVVAIREISTQTNPELLTTDKWEGFQEQFNLPMPDTCVNTIEYVGKEENSTAIVYTYKLPDGQQKANEEYYKFQQILAEICGFTCENRNDMVYINDESGLISLMMAGNDPELGYFLQISFSNSMSAKN